MEEDLHPGSAAFPPAPPTIVRGPDPGPSSGHDRLCLRDDGRLHRDAGQDHRPWEVDRRCRLGVGRLRLGGLPWDSDGRRPADGHHSKDHLG